MRKIEAKTGMVSIKSTKWWVQIDGETANCSDLIN
jgi:hypothetical protein